MEQATMEAKSPTNNKSAEPAFPYEAQSDHWDADFSNSKEVYQGAALPVWILAGWAVFIIWAIVYLMAGARTAF